MPVHKDLPQCYPIEHETVLHQQLEIPGYSWAMSCMKVWIFPVTSRCHLLWKMIYQSGSKRKKNTSRISVSFTHDLPSQLIKSTHIWQSFEKLVKIIIKLVFQKKEISHYRTIIISGQMLKNVDISNWN